MVWKITHCLLGSKRGGTGVSQPRHPLLATNLLELVRVNIVVVK